MLFVEISYFTQIEGPPLGPGTDWYGAYLGKLSVVWTVKISAGGAPLKGENPIDWGTR